MHLPGQGLLLKRGWFQITDKKGHGRFKMNYFAKKKSPVLSESYNEKIHIKEICKSKLQMTLSLYGSLATYRSMFVDLVKLKASSGIVIDTLLPKEGDLRLKPHTSITVRYDFKQLKYQFNAMVIQKVQIQHPSFLITLPKTISTNR